MDFGQMFQDMQFLFILHQIQTALDNNVPDAELALDKLIEAFEGARNNSIRVTNVFNDMIVAATNHDLKKVVALYTKLNDIREGKEIDKPNE